MTASAQRLPDGRIRIPRTAVEQDGTIGCGMDIIDPDSPLYRPWDEYLTALDRVATAGTAERFLWQPGQLAVSPPSPAAAGGAGQDDPHEAKVLVWHRAGLRLAAAPPVEVKLRKPWNPDLHPRDAKGRFIKIGARVHINPVAGGGDGTVRGLSRNLIDVERDSDHKIAPIAKGYLEVYAEPADGGDGEQLPLFGFDPLPTPDEVSPVPTPTPEPAAAPAARTPDATPEVAPGTGTDTPPGTPPRPPDTPAAPGGPPAGPDPVEVDGATFHAQIAAAREGRKGAFLSLYEVAEYEQMRTFLAHDGKVGGALKDHGDGRVEVVSLFNNGGPRGSGLQLAEYLMAQGGNYAECYGDDLRVMYEGKGFAVEESHPFDRSLAAPDWDYAANGTPNYYTMRKVDSGDQRNQQGDAGADGGRDRRPVPGPAADVVPGEPQPGQPRAAPGGVGVPVQPPGDLPPVTPEAPGTAAAAAPDGAPQPGDRVTNTMTGLSGVVVGYDENGKVRVKRDKDRREVLNNPKVLQVTQTKAANREAVNPEPPAPVTDEQIDAADVPPQPIPESAVHAAQDAARAAAGDVDAEDDPPGDMQVIQPETTHSFPSYLLGEAVARIEKANKRAERSGIPQRITYSIDKRWMKEVRGGAGGAGLTTYDEHVQITLNVPTLQHNGWTFAGTMTWEGPDRDTLITRLAPGAVLQHRPEARHCDVCHAKRDRRDTYVVQNAATGEERQVGSNCLEQFMGIKPQGLWLLGWDPELGDLDQEDTDPEAPGRGGPRDTHANIADALALTVALARTRGFTSRKQEQDDLQGRRLATASVVTNVMFGDGNMLGEDRRGVIDLMNTEDVIAEASALRDFAATLDGDTEYVLNLRAAAANDYISAKNLPLLVSAYAAKARNDDRRREQAEQATAGADSQHLGEKKGKIPATDARVTATRIIDGDYGPTTLITMITTDGNVVKWFASGHKDEEVGDEISISGTVKEHGEFRSVKETVLTRAKITGRGDQPSPAVLRAEAKDRDTPDQVIAEIIGDNAGHEDWNADVEAAVRAAQPVARIVYHAPDGGDSPYLIVFRGVQLPGVGWVGTEKGDQYHLPASVKKKPRQLDDELRAAARRTGLPAEVYNDHVADDRRRDVPDMPVPAPQAPTGPPVDFTPDAADTGEGGWVRRGQYRAKPAAKVQPGDVVYTTDTDPPRFPERWSQRAELPEQDRIPRTVAAVTPDSMGDMATVHFTDGTSARSGWGWAYASPGMNRRTDTTDRATEPATEPAAEPGAAPLAARITDAMETLRGAAALSAFGDYDRAIAELDEVARILPDAPPDIADEIARARATVAANRRASTLGRPSTTPNPPAAPDGAQNVPVGDVQPGDRIAVLPRRGGDWSAPLTVERVEPMPSGGAMVYFTEPTAGGERFAALTGNRAVVARFDTDTTAPTGAPADRATRAATRAERVAEINTQAREAAGLDDRWKMTRAGLSTTIAKLKPGDWIYTTGEGTAIYNQPELFRAPDGQRPRYANVRRTVARVEPHPDGGGYVVHFTDGTSVGGGEGRALRGGFTVFSAGSRDNPRDIDKRSPVVDAPSDPLSGLDLAQASDDELSRMLAQFADDDATLDRVIAELDRRDADDADPTPPNTPTQNRIDNLIAGGMSLDEAIAETFGVDPERMAAQLQAGIVDADRQAGQTREQAVRDAYDEWIDMQVVAAEQGTRGNLLSPEGKAAGVDPASLFSGPAHIARRNASEELKRWWAESGNPRRTFTEFKADMLGRAADRAEAERIRQQGNGRDFGL